MALSSAKYRAIRGLRMRRHIAGDMIIADQQVAPSTTSLAYGTANLNGGTLRATTMNGGGAHGGLVTFNFSSGVLASKAGTDLTVGAGVPLTLLTASAHTIDVEDGRTAAVNSAISGAAGTAGVTKTGEGTLLLNGANTYTGGTVVSAGTIGGTGSLASPVTVNAGADLAPGALVGTLTVAGDVDLEAGSDLIIEMDGGLIDLLAVSGLVDLSDATQRLMLYSPSARAAGAYTFLTAGSISGIFEEVYFNDILIPNPTAIGSIGGVLRLDYGDTALRLVPEPASAVLAALGLAALGHRRRRS